jgi:hypothetical protein
MNKTLCILATLIGLVSTAHAHQIWLEQPEGQNTILRFGEFGENLRETSPGLLDRLGQPTATLIAAGKETPLTVTKAADGFTLSGKLSPGQSIVAEDAAFPLRTFKQEGKDVTSWYHPAARFIADDMAQTPKLTLDLTPTGKAGEFRLTFKGQPLARTEVHLLVQSGWGKEARTNAEGVVTFDFPWQGQYVLEASHIDRTPGERPGAGKYDGINYVTTLTRVKPDGLPPVPAGPAQTPNK